MKKPKGYWTKEKCQEEALKYNSKMEFKNNSSSAYNQSVRNNWLNDICCHMIPLRKIRGYWTKEKCQDEALKYINKNDFNKNSKSAYLSSYKNGWLNEICCHMEPKGNIYKRCIYSYEFNDNNVYVGLTYNIEKRKCNRKLDKNDKVTKYINKTNLIPKIIQLTDYIDVKEAIKLEEYYVQKYINEEWNILNKNKTGGIGTILIKWNYNNCKEEALKYNRRTDFKNKCSGAYYTSIKNNWLNEICLHMDIKIKKPSKYWTKEKCQEEALKYNKKIQLLKNNKTVYNKCIKNNWLNDFFPIKH